jgi:hypothetical protein
VEIDLSAEDYDLLMRPVPGSGGWQSLLRKLQKQVEGHTLRLTESDSKRILRYILSYGSGGWQDRLAAAAGIAEREERPSTRARRRVVRKR